ncbi:peptidase S8/S53 domain-containing protein [Paraphysoderma sedebokerense]|nr:peptidase S8/S53 domain-containing protein [Paraphysoderma sedebokerense]
MYIGFFIQLIALSCVFVSSIDSRVLKRAPPNVQDKVTERAYIIEFQQPPTADGTPTNEIDRQHASFRSSLKSRKIRFAERKAFKELYNGISLVLDSDQDLETIMSMKGVKSVWPMFRMDHPKAESHSRFVEKPFPEAMTPTQDNVPQLRFAHNMTGVEDTQKKLGFTGSKVRVGVIDTGVDYTHPAFGQCDKVGSGEGCRVLWGYDFVGDLYTGFGSPISRDEDPMPCPESGHGTHVAGIIGGRDDKITGVAPNSLLGAYRVFGCNGTTMPDIMIDAMTKAREDGMQIINLSIGGGSVWPTYPTSIVADRLVNLGVVVVASAGNSGAKGLWQTGAPAIAEKALSVASFDNQFYVSRFLRLSATEQKDISFSTGEATPNPSTLPPTQVVYASKDSSVANDACGPEFTPPSGTSFENKLVLIRRGACTFVEKILNAQKFGAAGVIIYNNAKGVLSIAPSDENIKIPAVAVSDTDGVLILNAILKSELSSNRLTVSFPEGELILKNPTAGTISAFSSWGLSGTLAIKPDIAGIGGLVYSAMPMKGVKYAVLSGTSMSSPYVAGAIATYLEAHPDAKPPQIRDVMLNNAVPGDTSDMPNKLSVARQGAGLINVYSTILNKAIVTPSKLELKASNSMRREVVSLTIHNNGPKPMKFSLTHTPGVSVSGVNPDVPSLVHKPSRVKFSRDTVLVAPGGRAVVGVTIYPATDMQEDGRWIYSGYISIVPATEDEKDYFPISVPYAGFKGNYQRSIRVLPGPDSPYPNVAYDNKTYRTSNELVSVTKLDNANNNVTFNIRFEHPIPLFTLALYRFDNDQFVGYIAGQQGSGRFDMVDRMFEPVVWDGKVSLNVPWGAGSPSVQVEDGKYYAILRAKKPLGNDLNPKHFETWRSPKIEIHLKASDHKENEDDGVVGMEIDTTIEKIRHIA